METSENIKNKALGELISINRIGVLKLLNSFGYKPDKNSNNDISKALIEAMKRNDFVEQLIHLMKISTEQKSNFGDNESSTGSIISAALQAVGSVTSAWTTSANTKAQAQIKAAEVAAEASKYNADAANVKKIGTTGMILIIVTGVVVLTLGALAIFRFGKPKNQIAATTLVPVNKASV